MKLSQKGQPLLLKKGGESLPSHEDYLVSSCMLSKSKIVFKDYSPKQNLLFPPNIEELIPESHPVRVVDSIIEGIDIEPLLLTYQGGGTSSYHPRMLLKIIVYAYLRNIYSSRNIEDALKENIHFMWLSGMSHPDHNTIFRFRSKRLKNEIKKIFSQVVLLLAEEGHISLKEVFVDGTKIEANANRYTFVWGNAIKTNKEKIQKQLHDLWAYVEKVYKDEETNFEQPDFTEITPEKVDQAISQINEALKDKKISKKVRQKLKYASKNWPSKLKEYQEKEAMLNGRNSYSKTDPDATFMRMKEDHMQNGQLKPAYNLQLSTNDKFITCFTLTQTTTDTTTLTEHIDCFNSLYDIYPESVTADAGYGSEENYELLESKDIQPYVKYNYFHSEQSKKWRQKNQFKAEYLHYNPEQDCFYCPMGQPMNKTGTGTRETKTGYLQQTTYYQAKNCNGCPLWGACHKSKVNRIIEVNHNLIRHKKKAKALLNSEQGLQKRKQRAYDVEGTFAQLKNNKGFKRFLLRGLDKVEVELGILAIAHNLAKIAA